MISENELPVVKHRLLQEIIDELEAEKKERLSFPFWNNWMNWRNWGNWGNWMNWWT